MGWKEIGYLWQAVWVQKIPRGAPALLLPAAECSQSWSAKLPRSLLKLPQNLPRSIPSLRNFHTLRHATPSRPRPAARYYPQAESSILSVAAFQPSPKLKPYTQPPLPMHVPACSQGRRASNPRTAQLSASVSLPPPNHPPQPTVSPSPTELVLW